MQKSILLLSSLLTVVVTSLVLSSCKDDEPFVKPKLSLDESTMTVNEAAGTIEVDFVLDKAYSSDITIEYDLGGTATEGSACNFRLRNLWLTLVKLRFRQVKLSVQ